MSGFLSIKFRLTLSGRLQRALEKKSVLDYYALTIAVYGDKWNHSLWNQNKILILKKSKVSQFVNFHANLN